MAWPFLVGGVICLVDVLARKRFLKPSQEFLLVLGSCFVAPDCRYQGPLGLNSGDTSWFGEGSFIGVDLDVREDVASLLRGNVR